MTEQPTLTSARLVLRPFKPSDAADVQRLAGAKEIADTTLNIPHPYADGMAEAWIESHADAFRERERLALAITDSAGVLVGAISLRLEPAHRRAELGYWIGLPYWGRGRHGGGRAMVRYGFDELGLNRIHAQHFARNPASGRVLEKAGFTHEGFHRAHVLKNERFEDIAHVRRSAGGLRLRRGLGYPRVSVYKEFSSTGLLTAMEGDDVALSGIASVEECGPGDLVFVADEQAVHTIGDRHPSAVVTSPALQAALAELSGLTVLVAPNLKLAHALIRQRYVDRNVLDSEWPADPPVGGDRPTGARSGPAAASARRSSSAAESGSVRPQRSWRVR